jgi:hypothetical protein
VEVKEQVRQRRWVFCGQRFENELPIGRWHRKEGLKRLDPRLVDFLPALLFIAIAEMEAYIADQLLGIPVLGRVF